jgi:hypothetical protein
MSVAGVVLLVPAAVRFTNRRSGRSFGTLYLM